MVKKLKSCKKMLCVFHSLVFGRFNRNLGHVLSNSQQLIVGSNSTVIFPHLLLTCTLPPNIDCPSSTPFFPHLSRNYKAQQATRNKTLCQVCSSRWRWLWKERRSYGRQRGIIRSLITKTQML